MSTAALAFDWKVPVPQVFTRASGPTFWPGDRRYRPHDLAARCQRDLTFLTEALPPALQDSLCQRFVPAPRALRWATPPALPTNVRQGYDLAALRESSEEFVCAEITITANFIERLLYAAEGLVGGLMHNYLFAIQILRLRQLWEEVNRRAWAEPPLLVFARALADEAPYEPIPTPSAIPPNIAGLWKTR